MADQRPSQVGVDLGGTTVTMGFFSEDAADPDRVEQHPLEAHDTPREWLADWCEREPDLRDRPWVIGVPSPVRDRSHVAETPNLPDGWSGSAISDAFEEYDVEVFLENDANLAALGEWQFGAGREVNHLVLLTLGTGIGGGIIVDGSMLTGASGAAAEVGHMTLEPGGRLCGCGNTGCFERYGSASALEQTYEQLSGEQLSARAIADREKQDSLAREALTQTGLYLGRGVANLINLFEPQLVLFSGGLSRSLDRFKQPMKRSRDKNLFASRTRDIPMKRAGLDQPALQGTRALFQTL